MSNKNLRFRSVAVAIAAAMTMAGCATTTSSSESTTEAVTEASTESATESSTEAATEDSTEASTEVATEASTEDAEESISEGRHRRTLPHKTTEAAATTEEEEEDDNAVAEDYPTSTSEIVRLKSYKGDTVSFKERKSVKDTVATWDDDAAYPDSQEDMEEIMSGLATYWANGDMESVDYLVRMGKYMYLSQLLTDSEDYFYVGDENADGEPDGTGIAVYADNTYYYGEFKDGVREGQGFWYQIFVKDGAYSKVNNGIIGHSYNGEWANDLPNGEGQEHLDIDTAYLNGRIITNVATTFADGYYNGKIIATSLENNEGMTNWTGEARYGTMVVIDGEYVENKDGKAEIRVLENADNANNYYWMLMDENCGQGITGLAY